MKKDLPEYLFKLDDAVLHGAHNYFSGSPFSSNI